MRHWSLTAIACCPIRSPPSLWSRFPGGLRRSCNSTAKSTYSSFRRARRVISGGSRLDRPVTNSSSVCRSANVLITDRIVTRHVTLVKPRDSIRVSHQQTRSPLSSRVDGGRHHRLEKPPEGQPVPSSGAPLAARTRRSLGSEALLNWIESLVGCVARCGGADQAGHSGRCARSTVWATDRSGAPSIRQADVHDPLISR